MMMAYILNSLVVAGPASSSLKAAKKVYSLPNLNLHRSLNFKQPCRTTSLELCLCKDLFFFCLRRIILIFSFLLRAAKQNGMTKWTENGEDRQKLTIKNFRQINRGMPKELFESQRFFSQNQVHILN